MRITEKSQFRKMWLNGELGNKPRVWKSLQELKESEYRGTLSLRIHTPGSQHTMYGVPFDDLCKAMWHLAGNGVDTEQVWFNESAPDDRLVLQGEYTDIEKHDLVVDRYLMYSHAKTQMKTAMALPLGTPWEESQLRLVMSRPRFFDPAYAERLVAQRYESFGIQTDMLLQSVMNENSWADFQELRLEYPKHVIEFSVYDHCVGDCPHRNTLIWEVRDY